MTVAQEVELIVNKGLVVGPLFINIYLKKSGISMYLKYNVAIFSVHREKLRDRSNARASN
jgi:hypothetical protein